MKSFRIVTAISSSPAVAARRRCVRAASPVPCRGDVHIAGLPAVGRGDTVATQRFL